MPFKLPGEKSRRETINYHSLLPRSAFPFGPFGAAQYPTIVLPQPPSRIDRETDVRFVFSGRGEGRKQVAAIEATVFDCADGERF